MKIFIYVLIAVATGLIIYNSTFLDFNNLFNGESATALIGVLCASIVILLMIILLMSRSIAEKVRGR